MVAEVEEKEQVFVPSPRQAEFIAAALSDKYRHLLYGGAAGGGKTYVLCALIMFLCKAYPGSKWAIVRADLPRLKKSVIPTWNKFAPRSFFGPIHRTDWNVMAENGSEVIFFPASEDQDPEFERVRGIEVNGAAFEECDEVSEDFAMAMSSRYRWKVPGKVQPPLLSLYSCNPNQKWPKTRFYDPYSNGTLAPRDFYLPAKITDNPHISAEYLDQLRTLPPKQRSVFFDGNWAYADQPDQLIKGEWVEEAFERGAAAGGPDLKGRAKALGVDVARYGDDDTVIARTEGWHLVDLQSFHGIDTYRTYELAFAQAVTNSIPAHMIRVDTIGVGSGVADDFKRVGRMNVTEFIAGATKGMQENKYLHFKNLRSQAWWDLREGLREGKISFTDKLDPEAKRLLIADLIAPTYSVDNDKVISVESKDSIKSRLHRSTDYGDAVIMAFANMSPTQRFWDGITTR